MKKNYKIKFNVCLYAIIIANIIVLANNIFIKSEIITIVVGLAILVDIPILLYHSVKLLDQKDK